jgi:hypothetical protein
LDQILSATDPQPSLHAASNLTIPSLLVSPIDLTGVFMYRNPESSSTTMQISCLPLQHSPSWPSQSTPVRVLRPHHRNLEARKYGREKPPIESDDGNSAANALVRSLNATFIGTPNDSLQYVANPLDITLQPDSLALFHDFPDSNFDFYNNDSPQWPDLCRGFSHGSSDTAESNHDEPDGVRLAGKDRNEGHHQDRHLTDSESNSIDSHSNQSNDNRPDSNNPSEGQSDGQSTESDSDKMDGSSSSGNNSDNNSDEGPEHNKMNLQGVSFIYYQSFPCDFMYDS